MAVTWKFVSPVTLNRFVPLVGSRRHTPFRPDFLRPIKSGVRPSGRGAKPLVALKCTERVHFHSHFL